MMRSASMLLSGRCRLCTQSHRFMPLPKTFSATTYQNTLVRNRKFSLLAPLPIHVPVHAAAAASASTFAPKNSSQHASLHNSFILRSSATATAQQTLPAAVKPAPSFQQHVQAASVPQTSQQDADDASAQQQPQTPPRLQTAPKKKKSVRDIRSDDEFVPSPGGMVSAPPPQPLRLTAYCLAERFDLKQLQEDVEAKKMYTILPYMTDDVVHIRLSPPPSAPETSNANADNSVVDTSISGPEVFIFGNGTLALWGATDSETDQLLQYVRLFQENAYKTIDSEYFDYFDDPTSQSGIASDVIIIGNDLAPEQAKLAFSSGLVRSVKLGALETLLDEHLDKNRTIPEYLLRGKRLPFGRSAVLRNLGELFWLRGQANHRSEMLDSPDFCWSSSRMEGLFESVSRSLDVRPRIAIFNKKLDYANEIAEMLRNHLHEQHSLKLEWCIIILISVEIAFECVHYFDRFVTGESAPSS